jgi:hypothetical protein
MCVPTRFFFFFFFFCGEGAGQTSALCFGPQSINDEEQFRAAIQASFFFFYFYVCESQNQEAKATDCIHLAAIADLNVMAGLFLFFSFCFFFFY